MHIPAETHTKLKPKSIKGLFVGYSETQKAYHVYLKSTRKIQIFRHVTVFEQSLKGVLDTDDASVCIEGVENDMGDATTSSVDAQDTSVASGKMFTPAIAEVLSSIPSPVPFTQIPRALKPPPTLAFTCEPQVLCPLWRCNDHHNYKECKAAKKGHKSQKMQCCRHASCSMR
jgi:hypothetical protein